MFTAALFILAQNWKHIFISYKMDCDIFIKWESVQQGERKKLLLRAAKMGESYRNKVKKSHAQKTKCCIILCI